jgi:hypothetical protein
MFKIKGPEQKEERKVELKVVASDGDKGLMIGFEGKTKEECMAYNYAIESVLKQAGLIPFHQVGVTPSGSNDPGKHAWEVFRKCTAEDLERLLPQIEQKAKAML